jgi:8-oxo-dGTP pyrophosphatase MutT (NUDIX family)
MRAFPNVWVSPGGHLDSGESLLEAGCREVWEETGLHLSRDSMRFLCGWESCYPINTTPTRQHIVLDFTGRPEVSSESSVWVHGDEVTQLPSVNCAASEVQNAVWLSREAIKYVTRLSEEVGVVWVRPLGGSALGGVKLLEHIRDNIAEGTSFALRCWLRTEREEKPVA